MILPTSLAMPKKLVLYPVEEIGTVKRNNFPLTFCQPLNRQEGLPIPAPAH